MPEPQHLQQARVRADVKRARPQAPAVAKPQDATQMVEAPESLRPEAVLAAQQTVGNQVVQRALDGKSRRKQAADSQGYLTDELNTAIQRKRGGGSPLPEAVQKEAKKALGRDFKDVRIHTDAEANRLSRSISARAFTIGKDIFFKDGVFAPGTSAGRETIIHELTHVIQQSAGGAGAASRKLKLGGTETAQEKEAHQMGKKHASAVSAAAGASVQRASEEDELQMQGAEEEELLQAQPAEEDELQMQGEEEELQMQPDAANVVQRAWEEDKEKGGWKKKPEIVSPKAPTTKKKGVGGKIDLANQRLGIDAPTQLPGVDQAKMKKAQVTKANLNKELLKKVGGQEKQITGKSMNAIFHLEARRKEKFEENFGKQNYQKEQAEKEQSVKAAKDKAVDDAKQKWLATLKDPKSSPEEIAKAKERLGTFHKDVGKKDFKAAKNERRSALEEAAKTGDDEAYEKWQSERKKTKGEKAKRFFKSAGKTVGSGLLAAGKWTGSKALGFAKGKLNEGVNHFLGIKDDDKDKEDDTAKAPNVNVTANVGGGSGGGGEALSLIKELMQENRKLQDELASLKKSSQSG